MTSASTSLAEGIEASCIGYSSGLICSRRVLEASLAASYSPAASLACLGMPRPPSLVGIPIRAVSNLIAGSVMSLDISSLVVCSIALSISSQISSRPLGSSYRSK